MPYRGSNYQFVIDSSFRPFEMSEMLVPFTAYKDAFEKSEDAYLDLTSRADKFKYLADNLDPDSKAAQIYNGYANDLRVQAEDLASNGLNMSNRRALTGLKQRYQGEIGRLEQADAIRKAQIAEQQKILASDPTRIFSREAAMSTLDDYLDNPDLTYKNYSGALLTQQVGSAASAIAKSLGDSIKTGRLDDYTKTWIESHGFSSAEVLNAIENPNSAGAGKVLNSIVEQAVQSSGVPTWGNQAATDAAYAYARQGLWNAVGENKVHTYEDYGAKLSAQEAMQKRVAEHAANIAAQQQRATQHAMLTPRALRSQQEIADNTTKINSFIKNGYVEEKDGKYVITDLGKKVYASTIKVTEKDLPTWMDPKDRAAALRGLQSNNEQTEFRVFMDGLNGGKSLYDGKSAHNGGKGLFMSNHASNLFTKAVKNNSSDVYDIYHSTEYVRQLDDSYAKELKRQVMSEPEVLQSLDFNGKDGFKGKNIKKADLEKFTPTRMNYSKYGNTITWINDKNEVIRTNAPVAVNERVSNTVQQAMNNATLNAAVLREGKLPKTDLNGNPIIKDGIIQFSDTPLTDDMIRGYYNDWQEEMDIVNSVGSMYVTPSTTKNQEYKPYEFGFGLQNMFNSEEE